MSIIDFHAHILPELDDGSTSAERSLQMYQLSIKQGVDYILATPHFYALQDRIETFLEKREASYIKLQNRLQQAESEEQGFSSAGCKIIPGAEVAYFPGISEAEKLSMLTVQNTNLLLLELPFAEWKETIYKEVESLIQDRKMTVMLAHFERYLHVYHKKYMQELMELPAYIQINAGSLTDWRRRRGTLKLIEKSSSFVLGSDMHGMTHRPPNLGEGRLVLQKKCGSKILECSDTIGKRLLFN